MPEFLNNIRSNIGYEDLRATPAKCFAAALAFGGREAEPTQIERAIRYADFAELQRQENENGFGECMSQTAPFFRSAQVGGWRGQLTVEQAGAIVAHHEAVMACLGYDAK